MYFSVLQSVWTSLLKEFYWELLEEKGKICLVKEILKKSPPVSAKRALFNELTINNLNFATSKIGLIKIASICPLFSSLKTLTFSLI